MMAIPIVPGEDQRAIDATDVEPIDIPLGSSPSVRPELPPNVRRMSEQTLQEARRKIIGTLLTSTDDLHAQHGMTPNGRLSPSLEATFVSALCITPSPHLDTPHPQGDTGIPLPVLVDIDIDDSRLPHLTDPVTTARNSPPPGRDIVPPLPPPFLLPPSIFLRRILTQIDPRTRSTFLSPANLAICDKLRFPETCDIYALASWTHFKA
ncbi:hypothetical protein A1Q2_05331 [Trichosporon asahii var. asahii CBS 8904]|uniref:Uncharacterized protein n=1 Tax=Trichosporon asahii var. asahii (strain CBS 8904) TaxID=1220162 RepID=K1VLY4_TRIAC|nr:hypothetical protein A1Q2_05331 [Trichosporon asahii var. asahii CBS 8904]